MKTNENVFNADKHPESRNPREFTSHSKENSEEDQSSTTDENPFRNKGLRSYHEPGRSRLSENHKQNPANPSYSFVVDWQIPESSY
jgi:hypothetical protein